MESEVLNKRMVREATLGLVVLAVLLGVLFFTIYMKARVFWSVASDDLLSTPVHVYEVDRGNVLIPTRRPPVVPLPGIESNQIVDLGDMRPIAPERFAQLTSQQLQPIRVADISTPDSSRSWELPGSPTATLTGSELPSATAIPDRSGPAPHETPEVAPRERTPLRFPAEPAQSDSPRLPQLPAPTALEALSEIPGRADRVVHVVAETEPTVGDGQAQQPESLREVGALEQNPAQINTPLPTSPLPTSPLPTSPLPTSPLPTSALPITPPRRPFELPRPRESPQTLESMATPDTQATLDTATTLDTAATLDSAAILDGPPAQESRPTLSSPLPPGALGALPSPDVQQRAGQGKLEMALATAAHEHQGETPALAERPEWPTLASPPVVTPGSASSSMPAPSRTPLSNLSAAPLPVPPLTAASIIAPTLPIPDSGRAMRPWSESAAEAEGDDAVTRDDAVARHDAVAGSVPVGGWSAEPHRTVVETPGYSVDQLKLAMRRVRLPVGMSMEALSERLYGDSRYAMALLQLNHRRADDRGQFIPGTQIMYLPAEMLAFVYPDLIHAVPALGVAEREAVRPVDYREPAAESLLPLGQRPSGSAALSQNLWYVTQGGESLFQIAADSFDQASFYLQLFEWNRDELEGRYRPTDPLPKGLRLRLTPGP